MPNSWHSSLEAARRVSFARAAGDRNIENQKSALQIIKRAIAVFAGKQGDDDAKSDTP